MKELKTELHIIGSGNAFHEDIRGNQCFLLKIGNKNILIDCGPTSLYLIKKQNIDLSRLDYIILTHFHGDHIGGIPEILLYLKEIKRQNKDVKLIGAKGISEVVANLCNLFFGGIPIELISHEINSNEHTHAKFSDFEIFTYPMSHKPESIGYKIKTNSFCLSITGDTGYNVNLKALADNSDLFITEASFVRNGTETHLSLEQIISTFPTYNTKSILLVHPSKEVVDEVNKRSDIPSNISLAYDGMKISLS